MRHLLAQSKRFGTPFAEAWDDAWRQTNFGHDKKHREAYYAALEDCRWAFERAYHGEDVPGGRALELLADTLGELREAGGSDPSVLSGRSGAFQGGAKSYAEAA